jgi:hypothetical protein
MVCGTLCNAVFWLQLEPNRVAAAAVHLGRQPAAHSSNSSGLPSQGNGVCREGGCMFFFGGG